MKNGFLFVLILLASCGSPLDEGYWKEHNQEAEDNDDGSARSFRIDLEPLHDFTLEFSNQSFRRLENGRISVSAEVFYPDQVTLQSYRIESIPCTNISPLTYNLTINDQTNVFNYTRDLAQMTDNVNQNIEGSYLYLYGSWAGQTNTRIACSQISL